MKNKIKTLNLLVIFGLALNLNAQYRGLHSSRTRSNTEKVERLQRSKEDILIEKLGIGKDKEVAFKNLFKIYDDEMSAMIKDSRKGMDIENPSDKEIRDRIYARFNLYQKLLDHRKVYSDKFLEVLSPRQLEKMFEMERLIGRGAVERKHKMMDKNKIKSKKGK